MLDIANELNLTERHAYRLLRRAVLALAQILEERNWFQATQALPPGTALPHDAAAADDLDMLVPTHRDGVDLVNLVNTVVQDIRSLATPKGITISGPNQRFAIRVIINRVMLRQALVNLLSTVVQAQEEGTVEVGVHAVPHRVIVRVRCEAPPELVSRLDGTPSSVASRLLAALDIFPSYQRLSPREIVCDIPIPLTEKLAVLLIDDNVGLLALFTRYLALGPYLVRGASSAEEGMAIANDWHPDIIILDVMMPDRDGWEVIRHLRRTEAGKEAHIIICSVVNDPELAIALGADGFLPKPVTRAALLAALPSDRRHRI
jgi:CheY-like chemotaxis protein